ncbi:hypothetical protein ACJ41O_009755 [Fusarium nematophilum]
MSTSHTPKPRPSSAADVSRIRSPSASHDRHDRYAPTTPSQQQQQQRQQANVSRPLPNQTPDPIERLSTPTSLPRSLRRTPRFEAPSSPAPEPRKVHLAAASLGFTPKATPAVADHLPESHPTVLGLIPVHSAPPQAPRRRRRLSQDLTEDPDEVSSEHPRSPPGQTPSSVSADRVEPHPVVRISKHTHSAILFALEEALRNPNPFTPDLEEESASMADLMASGGVPPVSNGKPSSSPFRPTAAPGQTGSPSGIRGPRMIMQERAAREARQRAEAEQQQRERAEQEARILEQARRAEEQRRSAGVAVGQGAGVDAREPANPQRQAQAAPETTTRPRASTTSQPPPTRPSRSTTNPQQPPPQTFTAPVPAPQPSFSAQPAETAAQGGAGSSKPRNSFPHAFERWETLSAHWEGLTSYWIRKLEQNKDELNRDPLNQQLARQVTDLSAAGANLFHAVVELQRLRASSERKFQRWFFETRADLERSQEVNAMLEAALDQERRGRADAIREAVENERGTSKAQRQLAEMRKELSISKEEARRAWEELGRREQEERDRTLSLQSGQPTIVGGVQVVPMTQGGSSRHTSARAQGSYQTEYAQPGYPPEPTASPQSQPPTTAGGEGYLQPGQQGSSGYQAAVSEGGYSEGEYVIDANGNFLLDAQGNRIPFAAPPSTYSGSDAEAEEYETPATTNPPSGKQESPSTSAGGSQWTGAYSDPQDYSGQGYGAPGWETVPRHHHPTRLSDVMEEEDERSRASTSRV